MFYNIIRCKILKDMVIVFNSFLLTVLMFAAGAFITKALGWDKEED